MKKLILIACFVFISNTSNAQWMHWSPWGTGGNVTLLATGNNHIFSNFLYLSWYDTTRHVWVTADTGIDFSNNAQITDFATIGSELFSENVNGIYRSSNNGSLWSNPSPPYTSPGGTAFTSLGTSLFQGGLGDSGYGIYRSNDSSKTWFPVFVGEGGAVLISGGNFILDGYSDGTILSIDSGQTWHFSGPNQENALGGAIAGTTLWAGTKSGHIRKSIDSGQNWTTAWNADTAKERISVTSFAISGSVMFAGTMGEGVLESTDSGANWTQINDGLLQFGIVVNINVLAIFDSSLVCATDHGVASRPLSQLLPPKSSVAEVIPMGLTLFVYPNPAIGLVTIFAGSTSIYGVRVLNVLGVEVMDMPNARESEMSIDVSKLLAGTYFFEIQTSNGTELRKIAIER